MPLFAKAEKVEENHLQVAQDEILSKSEKEMFSEDELREMIRPEIVSINIPAILEILFWLFLLFVAIIKIGWHFSSSGFNRDISFGFLIEGIVFIILMFVSFIVAYGLIIKKKFAPIVGLGKGVFFIFYFINGIFYYRHLADNVISENVIFLSNLSERTIYETNIMVNGMLLIFVLILTLSMFQILLKEGYLDKVLKKNAAPATENKD